MTGATSRADRPGLAAHRRDRNARRSTLHHRLMRDPDDVPAYLDLIDLAADEGNYARATELARAGARRGHFELSLRAIYLDLRAARHHAAYASTRTLLREAPASWLARYAVRSLAEAILAEIEGAHDLAIAGYRFVLEGYENSTVLAHHLVGLLHRQYRNEEMQAIYREHLAPNLSIPAWTGGPAFDRVTVRHALVLYFFGRGGSRFVASLLDGHPEIIGPSFGMPHWDYLWSHGAEHSVEVLYAMIARPFHPDAHLEDLFFDGQLEHEREGPIDIGDDEKVDRLSYMAALKHVIESRGWAPEGKIAAPDYMTALALAYMLARGLEFDNGPVVLFHHAHHRRPRVDAFVRDHLPEVRTLFAIREPVQSLLSHLRDARLNPVHDPGRVASRHSLGINLGLEYPPPEQGARGIRLEDLKRAPESATRALAEFAGIHWRDCLLQSTTAGTPFRFRCHSGEVIEGFDARPLQRKHDEFGTFDRWRLRALCLRLANAWEYAQTHPVVAWLIGLAMALTLWIPFRFELDQLRTNRRHRDSWRLALDAAAREYVALRRIIGAKLWADLVASRPIMPRLAMTPDSPSSS